MTTINEEAWVVLRAIVDNERQWNSHSEEGTHGTDCEACMAYAKLADANLIAAKNLVARANGKAGGPVPD